MITYKSMPDYVLRNIAGDKVLVKIQNNDFGNDSVFVFNDSGAFLWENLSEKKSKAQLVTLLSQAYDIDQTQAESDVSAFLEKCVTDGLVSEKKEGI